MQKTYTAKPEDITRQWYVVDAEGQTLGRLATRIATLLRGKHKPLFTPSMDCGDFIIVLNAEKVVLSGRKETQKTYYHHTGYIGNLKSITVEKQRQKDATKLVEKAVWGMIPHNRQGREQITRLKVYLGSEHPHTAQQPQALPEAV